MSLPVVRKSARIVPVRAQSLARTRMLSMQETGRRAVNGMWASAQTTDNVDRVAANRGIQTPCESRATSLMIFAASTSQGSIVF
jgi:hypothetical protein